MKSNIWVLMLAALFVGAGLAHAEGMPEGMKGHHGMMDGKMMSMHSMMKGMQETKVIATSDGGVVVIDGNTLTKYDKNLNLVKTVELKGCKDCMNKMEGSKGKCPMMSGMKHDQDGDGDDVPAKVDEHAGHHAEKK